MGQRKVIYVGSKQVLVVVSCEHAGGLFTIKEQSFEFLDILLRTAHYQTSSDTATAQRTTVTAAAPLVLAMMAHGVSSWTTCLFSTVSDS